MSEPWRVIDPKTNEFIDKWIEEGSRQFAAFIKDAALKAIELGGKISLVHDTVFIDVSPEALVELREWAKTHPAPASVKRGLL